MSQIVGDLSLIGRCGAHYRSRQLEPLGLNPRQARLLLEVCATPGISQDTLSRRLCVEKSAVARSLAGLEEQGYVARPTCQKDKRVTRVHPTEKALAVQPRLQELWADCELFLTEGMTEEDVAQLERLLNQMKLQAVKWMEVDK